MTHVEDLLRNDLLARDHHTAKLRMEAYQQVGKALADESERVWEYIKYLEQRGYRVIAPNRRD